jgi:hypothetical protein
MRIGGYRRKRPCSLKKNCISGGSTNDLNTDKGEVGGSSPPRPTINPQYLCGYFEFCRPSHSSSKSCLPKICQNSGQAHPDARKIFRAFFVAAGVKRKTIELSVRSLCTTARSTDPEVGYKPKSPLKLEYIRQENGTSTDCAFSSQVD